MSLLRRAYGGCRLERGALVFSVPVGGEVTLLPRQVELVEERAQVLRVRAPGRGPLAELLTPLVAPAACAEALAHTLGQATPAREAVARPRWWRTGEAVLGLALLPVLLVQGGLLPVMDGCYATLGVVRPRFTELVLGGLLAAWAAGSLPLVAALARTPRVQAWASAGVLVILAGLLARALVLPFLILVSPL